MGMVDSALVLLGEAELNLWRMVNAEAMKVFLS